MAFLARQRCDAKALAKGIGAGACKARRTAQAAKHLSLALHLASVQRQLASPVKAVRGDQQLEQADPATLQLISTITQ